MACGSSSRIRRRRRIVLKDSIMACTSWARRCRLQRCRLQVEELEDRRLLAGIAPTDVEQVFLERLNDARANPAAYGAAIGLDLSGVAPSQPLAFDPLLIQAALGHSQDMDLRNYFGHNTPEGIDPGARISATGFAWTSWGESIAAGATFTTPDQALKALIIDSGVADLGHRRQLLAIDPMFKTQEQVGIGIVLGGTGTYANYYTIDSASSPDTRPFITGVVYNDSNHSGRYDAGEGLGNVVIHVTGTNAAGQPVDVTTATYETGGYAVRLDSGTYTVTASGGNLAGAVTQTVALGSSNARLDFGPNYNAFVQALYQTALGRTASSGDVAYWSQAVQAIGLAGVTHAINLSTEALERVVDGWYQQYLGRSAFDTQGNFGGQYWVGLLQQGMREEQVLPGILSSQEFYNRSAQALGSPSQTQANDSLYIQALYRQLFINHTAGSAEESFWLSQLPRLGRAGLTSALFNSAEHRAVAITGLYANVLRRTTAPSQQEVNYWVSTGLDLMSICMVFESLPEFVNHS
jgi:uncharacterized protein YkwD